MPGPLDSLLPRFEWTGLLFGLYIYPAIHIPSNRNKIYVRISHEKFAYDFFLVLTEIYGTHNIDVNVNA